MPPQEFLAFLLDGLHEDLNLVKLKRYVEDTSDSDNRRLEELAAEAWQRHLDRNKSVVVDMFHGLLLSSLTCSQSGCGKVGIRTTPLIMPSCHAIKGYGGT